MIRHRTVQPFVVASAVLVSVSCAGSALAPADVQLVVRNRSSDSVAFLAFDREASNLVSPNPGPLTVRTFGTNVAAPGKTVTTRGSAIDGFRVGADVRLFLYRVVGGQATFAATFDVLASQFLLPAHVIDLPMLASAP